MKLEGKTALVTGASSGMGRSIALALAAEGIQVGLLARHRDKLKQVRSEIESAGGRAFVVPADVNEVDQVEEAVRETAAQGGGLQILVNNAGLGLFKPVEELSLEEWDKHIDVMLRGAFIVTKAALPHIYAGEAGHIFFISSLWAKRFCGTCSAYTAAKFGVRGFAQSLREEARQHNVRVTNIMPGTVNTPFFEKANWNADLDRALLPEDVAYCLVSALKLPDRAMVEELVMQSMQPGPGTCSTG